MPIKIRCPNPDCEFAKALPDSLAGKKAKCPECGQRFVVPGSRVRPAADDDELTQVISQAVIQMAEPKGGAKKGTQSVQRLVCPECGDVYEKSLGGCPRCAGVNRGIAVSRRTRRQRVLALKIAAVCVLALVVFLFVRAHRRGADREAQRALGQVRELLTRAETLQQNKQYAEALNVLETARGRLLPVQDLDPDLMSRIEEQSLSVRTAEVRRLQKEAETQLSGGNYDTALARAERARKLLNELALDVPELEEQIAALVGETRKRRRLAEEREKREMQDKGLVRFEGKWIKPEERRALLDKRFAAAQRARGLNWFDGEWLTAEEAKVRRRGIERARVPVALAALEDWLSAWHRDVNVNISVRRERGDDICSYYWVLNLAVRNKTDYAVRLEGPVLLLEHDADGKCHPGVLTATGAGGEVLNYLQVQSEPGRVELGIDPDRFWQGDVLQLDAWVPMLSGPVNATQWQRLDVVIPRLTMVLAKRPLLFVVIVHGRYEKAAWRFERPRYVPWDVTVMSRVLADDLEKPLVRRLACYVLGELGGESAVKALSQTEQLAGTPAEVRRAARQALEKLGKKE